MSGGVTGRAHVGRPDLDAITVDQLRAVGGLKWSAFPADLGAFVAEMDFGTAPEVVEALHAAVTTGRLGYLPPAASDAMGEAVAGWNRDRYGWSVPASSVRPVADVVSALRLAIEHFCRPGSPVIVTTPAYMPFLTVPGALGREIIEVPVLEVGGRRELDLDGVDRAFAAGGGLLVLCNPYNPLGRVLTREELLAVSEVVERHGGRVFADEIHAPLVYAGGQHVPYASVSDAAAKHSVTSSSASKAWNLAGLKCAQLILTNEPDLAVWGRVGEMAEHGASTPGVLASTAAFTAGGPWLDGVLSYLDGNRRLLGDLLEEHLPEVRYTPPEGTYLAWLDCRALGLDSTAGFFREHAGVVLVDGPECGAPGRGHLRLNFATPAPVLTDVVTRMATAVRSR